MGRKTKKNPPPTESSKSQDSSDPPKSPDLPSQPAIPHPAFVEVKTRYPLLDITFLGGKYTIALKEDANFMLIFLSLISLGNEGINNLFKAAGVVLRDYQDRQFWPKPPDADPNKEKLH